MCNGVDFLSRNVCLTSKARFVGSRFTSSQEKEKRFLRSSGCGDWIFSIPLRRFSSISGSIRRGMSSSEVNTYAPPIRASKTIAEEVASSFGERKAFRLQNPARGICQPKARDLARAAPTRTPVKEPGPWPTATRQGRKECFFNKSEVSSASFLDNSGPPERKAKSITCPSSARTIHPFSVEVSKTIVFMASILPFARFCRG